MKLRTLQPRVRTLDVHVGSRAAPVQGQGSAFVNSRTAGQRLRGRALQARRLRIATRDRFQCRICNLVCLMDEGVVDHTVNLAAGGEDTDDNCQWVHEEPCHREKTQREASEGR